MTELDDADTVDGIELPGADLSGEEPIIQVIPQAVDEFTCYFCFLIRHRSHPHPPEGRPRLLHRMRKLNKQADRLAAKFLAA